MMSYCSIHWEEYPKGMLCKFCVAGISREAVLKSRGVIPIISIKRDSLQILMVGIVQSVIHTDRLPLNSILCLR